MSGWMVENRHQAVRRGEREEVKEGGSRWEARSKGRSEEGRDRERGSHEEAPCTRVPPVRN